MLVHTCFHFQKLKNCDGDKYFTSCDICTLACPWNTAFAHVYSVTLNMHNYNVHINAQYCKHGDFMGYVNASVFFICLYMHFVCTALKHFGFALQSQNWWRNIYPIDGK